MRIINNAFIIVGIFFGILLSCKNNAAITTVPVKSASPDAEDSLRNNRQQSEERNLLRKLGYWTDTLDISEVRLNGIPVFVSWKEFNKNYHFENSHSEFPNCGSPFDWMDSTYKFDSLIVFTAKGIEFNSNGNTVLPVEIDMHGNKLELLRFKKVLSGKTTIEELGAIFPWAYDNFIGAKKSGRYQPDKNGFYTIDVSFSHFDDKWIFYFKDGHLVKVKLWWLLC